MGWGAPVGGAGATAHGPDGTTLPAGGGTGWAVAQPVQTNRTAMTPRGPDFISVPRFVRDLPNALEARALPLDPRLRGVRDRAPVGAYTGYLSAPGRFPLKFCPLTPGGLGCRRPAGGPARR